ncbi:MAG: O-antigen ligase family protein, partial [Candidatus Altimarinota bacterium]
MKLKTAIFALTAIALSQLLLFWFFRDFNFTVLCLVTILASILVWRHLFLGIYIVLLLPVLGEFSRLEILGRSIVASDFIIPIFIAIWFFKQGKNLKFSQATLKFLKKFALFIFLAIFSLLLALIAIPTKEVLSGSLYLIRLIGYFTLLPITISILSTPSTAAPKTSAQTAIPPSELQKNFQNLLTFIGVSAFLIALTGFIQLQILPDLEGLESLGYDPHINRLVGSWLDPNFIGGFFAFIICIFSGVFFYLKDRRQQIATFLLIAILAIALFLTYSRSAYLALAIGIFILGMIKSRKALIILVIVATLGISVSDRAQQRVGELITSITSVLFSTAENPDPTARLRIENWNQTLSLIAEKLFFGHGYNTLTYNKLERGYLKDADNHAASGSDSSLLTILATTGLLGLLAFLTTILHPLVLAARQAWTQKTPLYQGYSLGL